MHFYRWCRRRQIQKCRQAECVQPVDQSENRKANLKTYFVKSFCFGNFQNSVTGFFEKITVKMERYFGNKKVVLHTKNAEQKTAKGRK